MRRPAPPQADFAFCIDFKRGEGNASRVFTATHEFIQACERLDRELISSIDTSIETVMVLEDIEAGSLKTWLRYALTVADDEFLKNLDWKALVGKFLVKCKYVILQWINDDSKPRNVSVLSQEIQKLASETDVRHIDDYMPVSPPALFSAVRDFEGVKNHLVEGDKASVITPDGEDIDFNLAVRIDVEEIEALATKETQVHTVPNMSLIVRKPDYLGSSMWGLRLQGKAILARIEDGKWLSTSEARCRCQAGRRLKVSGKNRDDVWP